MEVIGTTALKYSEQFTKLTYSIGTVCAYAAAFYFLSLTLRTVPVGVAYAIWSGAGILLITLVGVFAFKQIPDLPTIIGLALIVGGIIIINVFSKAIPH